MIRDKKNNINAPHLTLNKSESSATHYPHSSKVEKDNCELYKQWVTRQVPAYMETRMGTKPRWWCHLCLLIEEQCFKSFIVYSHGDCLKLGWKLNPLKACIVGEPKAKEKLVPAVPTNGLIKCRQIFSPWCSCMPPLSTLVLIIAL